MDDHQINIAQTQFFKRVINRLRGLIEIFDFSLELRRDENLFSTNSGFANASPHTFFITVRLSGINVSVS